MQKIERSLRALGATVVACALGATGFAANYNIAIGAITDHANASVTGSIAQVIAAHPSSAANPNTFTLTSTGNYMCSSTLTLPSYAKLIEGAGVQAVVKGNTSFAGGGTLLLMQSHTEIVGIEVNGNYQCVPVVQLATGATDLKLTSVALQGGRKVVPPGESSVIYMNTNTAVVVDGCILRRAGCDDVEANFMRRGALIRILGGDGITIKNSDLAVCPSAGIAIAEGNNIEIDNNTIHDTGRANISEYLADGITMYHMQQTTGTITRNIYITNNTIYDSTNHGIHMSGRGIHILNNTIHDVAANPTGTGSNGRGSSSLYLGDQRSTATGEGPRDCSYDFEANYNNLADLPLGGGKTIKRNSYKQVFYMVGNYRGTPSNLIPSSEISDENANCTNP